MKMKKNLLKRTMAIVFALTLMLGTFTISGFADEETGDDGGMGIAVPAGGSEGLVDGEGGTSAEGDNDSTVEDGGITDESGGPTDGTGGPAVKSASAPAPAPEAGVAVVSTVSLHNSQYAKVGLKQYSSNKDTVEIAPGVTLTTNTGTGKWMLHFADGVSGQYSIYVHHGGNEASLITIDAVGPVDWEIGDGGGHSMSINHIKFGAVGQPEQDPVTPIVTIFKNTNMDGKFKFAATVDGDTEYVTIKTKCGKGYYDYELPDNFTGTMAISELAWYNGSETGLDGWDFDDAEYELSFEKGELVSPRGAELDVTFNNYYKAEEERPEAPEITVTKVSDAGENGVVASGNPVGYTVTVENTGGEDIWNLIINDDRFGMVTGGVKVSVMQPGDNGFSVLDESQGTYYFGNAIVFAEDFVLEVGGIIKVEYAIAWTGVGNHTNKVAAEGLGIESREPVSGDGEATVIIEAGNDPGNDPGKDPVKGGTTIRRNPETTNDGGVSIPSEDVPLAQLPDQANAPIELMDEEVPLGDIPQTGTDDMALRFGLLGLSLSALLALIFTKKRKAN